MASEITVQVSLKATKGNFILPKFGGTAFQPTMTGTNSTGGTQAIGTATHETLPVTDVGAAGWAYFKNTDATNFVQIGTDNAGTFIPFLKLLATEEVVCRLATAAPYAKADTASVDLQFQILET